MFLFQLNFFFINFIPTIFSYRSFAYCSNWAEYNFAVQTCWSVRKLRNWVSHRISPDRWSTDKWYRVADIRDNSLRHISWSICRDLDHVVFGRRPLIRRNNIAFSNVWHWFSNELRPFDCSRASAPNWSVNYHKMLLANAFAPLRCAAIPNWSACSIGSSAEDICGWQPHCMIPSRLYYSAEVPANRKSQFEWNCDRK